MAGPVLIIEDDPDIAEGLNYGLKREQFETRVALTGEEGLLASLDKVNPPAIILLDLLLPGMNGSEICRRLRCERSTRRVPILMMSAKASAVDIALGLNVGADDYITKPFSIREVIDRIRFWLRRRELDTPEIYDDGKLRIDFAAGSVCYEDVSIRLTNVEFALLDELAAHPGKIATRQQLIDRVWSAGHCSDSRKFDFSIQRLRSTIKGCGDLIETVTGVGYRFVGNAVGTTDSLVSQGCLLIDCGSHDASLT